VPGISAVQIGGDLYQPAELTLGGVPASTSSGGAKGRGSRAARAGMRKMLDDNEAAPEQPSTEQAQDNGTIMIDGEPYVKVSGR